MDKDFTKLIKETYRLLDCFPAGDPLRNKAKEKTLRILESLSIILQKKIIAENTYQDNVMMRLLADVEVLEKYLELGQSQGWLSNMNLLILKKEYASLRDQIHAALLQHMPQDGITSTVKPSEPRLSQNTPVIKEEKAKKSSQKSLEEQFSDRQALILKILSDKERVQVSDIIKKIPNVTKRTLRRDLDDLLKKGKIIRAGEWNKISYQLGQSQMS